MVQQLKQQAGTEMSFVDRANHFAMTGYPIPTTESDIKEQNIAGFLNYAFSVEKFGNLTAGLRYELSDLIIRIS